MDDGIYFDNVVVGNDGERAAEVREATWAPKHAAEVSVVFILYRWRYGALKEGGAVAFKRRCGGTGGAGGHLGPQACRRGEAPEGLLHVGIFCAERGGAVV